MRIPKSLLYATVIMLVLVVLLTGIAIQNRLEITMLREMQKRQSMDIIELSHWQTLTARYQ